MKTFNIFILDDDISVEANARCDSNCSFSYAGTKVYNYTAIHAFVTYFYLFTISRNPFCTVFNDVRIFGLCAWTLSELPIGGMVWNCIGVVYCHSVFLGWKRNILP